MKRDRTSIGNRPAGADDGKRAEELLTAAQVAQEAFWQALSDLESELDIEIDGTTDLNDHTLESLLELDEDEDI